MSESSRSAPAQQQKMLPLPDVADVIFILLINFLLFARPTFVFGDGSTGWHLVAGEWILQNHDIPRHDLISYTLPDKAWVAYEWLSDAAMALLVRMGGLNLLAV